MTLGCLGDIVFTVGDDTYLTVKNFCEKASAKYATHQRHNGSALAEFVGTNAETITFDIELSAWLGVSPEQEIKKLYTALYDGKQLSLMLGNVIYGRYRWVVQDLQIKTDHTDNTGTRSHVTASVTLLEYLQS